MATEVRPVAVSAVHGEQLALTTTVAALGIPQKRDTVQCRGAVLRSTADFRFQIGPKLRAFCKTADAGATFTDYTDEVTDRDTGTVALLNSLDTLANGDYLLVGASRQFAGLALDLGNMNGTPSVLAVHYWDGSAWQAVAGFADGTDNPAGTTLGKDGAITWTLPTDWEPATLNGFQGYFVRLSVSVQLDATVSVRGAALLSKDANRGYGPGALVMVIPVGDDDGAIEALVAAGTATLDVTWCYGDTIPTLAQAVALGGASGQKVDLVAVAGTAPTVAGKVDVKSAAGDIASLDILLSALRDAITGGGAGAKTLANLAALLAGGLPAALGADGGLKVSTAGATKALLPATAVTADAGITGGAVSGLSPYSRAIIELTISAKSMDAATTLDIYVQYLLPDGTTYDDIAHFTQIPTGAPGNGTYVMYLVSGGAGVVDRASDDAATLAANTVRNIPWSDSMRIKAVGANFAGADTITIKVDGYFLP